MGLLEILQGILQPTPSQQEESSLYSVTRQYKPDEKPYTATERTTTEYLTGSDLKEYKKLTPDEQQTFAQKKFGAPGQTVISAKPSGKLEINDYFKSYNTPEDFDQDMANLLSSRNIGKTAISDKEYAKNLQGWYATYSRRNKTGQLEKAYAADLMGTTNRANSVRSVILDPNFQQLAPVQQFAILSYDNLIHNSFKSDELRAAEKELNTAKKLKAKDAIKTAQDNIYIIKSTGRGVNPEKVNMMFQNIQRGWDAAKNISAKLNNNVSPEILFAQMAMETYYFTKPIAENNLTSIKITNQDRQEIKGQQKLQKFLKEQNLL